MLFDVKQDCWTARSGGAYVVSLDIDEHWAGIESLLKKYADRPISLADASPDSDIRC
jgi:hypothetical protein